MKKKQAVETSQKLIQDEEFKGRHRNSRTAFTRVRKLPFSIVIILILQKSVKRLPCRDRNVVLFFISHGDLNFVSPCLRVRIKICSCEAVHLACRRKIQMD